MPYTAKRLTAGAAAVAIASMALTACAGGAPADKTEQVTQLTIPMAETPWLPSFEKIVADYEAKTGIDIVLRTFPMAGLLTQEANAAQSGSNGFDLFLINEQWVGQFYDNEWVQPLADIDPDFKWDENLIEFDGVGRWDADTRTTSLDGEPYSLPINGNIHLFMYRKDLYEQLGLKVPTTWDEVVKNGEAAQAAGVVDDGYVLRGKTPAYDFSAVLYSFGGKWFEDERGGDWRPAIDSPEGKAALEQFKALADIGPAAPQTIAQAEATSLMQGGSVLQATFVAAVAAPLEDKDASLVADKIGYAVLPGQTPASGTWTMGVPYGLPEDRSQAAYDFLTWLTSKDAMQAWAGYGGITTRTDIESDRPELKAIVDSADMIRGGFRYAFAPAMVKAVEPIMSQYLAGAIDVDTALAQMSDAMTTVVTEAGYLK